MWRGDSFGREPISNGLLRPFAVGEGTYHAWLAAERRCRTAATLALLRSARASEAGLRAVTLEEVWPSSGPAGLELVWAAQRAWIRTRAAEGGLVAMPGGRLESIVPRPAAPMLPAAGLGTNDAVLTNRGGVTLANGCHLQGSGLATSFDVAPLRFFPTSRLEDCEVSEAVLRANPATRCSAISFSIWSLAC